MTTKMSRAARHVRLNVADRARRLRRKPAPVAPLPTAAEWARWVLVWMIAAALVGLANAYPLLVVLVAMSLMYAAGVTAS